MKAAKVYCVFILKPIILALAIPDDILQRKKENGHIIREPEEKNENIVFITLIALGLLNLM